MQRLLNLKIHGRLNNLNVASDTNIERDLINTGVRIAISDLSLRGSIREAVLTPGLMENNWDYALPTDALGDQIIDLRPQATDSRGLFETYDLVPPQEFDRRKLSEKGIATILNDDLTRILRVSADVSDNTLQISNLDDTAAGGGDWTTFDTNTVNDSDVKADADDFIEGSGSIRFQTDTSDTTDSTIGVQNATLTAKDISSYLARGSVFVDAKLTVADTGIHQITVRLGSDSNNYYQISDSNQNDCSAFQTGWNKIRWDFVNKTTTGTPTDTAIDYAAIFWNRDTTAGGVYHLNDTDWGFDNLVLKRGKYYLLSYYSRNVWQDTGDGSQLLENSADDSDALMVQNDELEVVMAKCAELASAYLRDDKDVMYHAKEYERLKSAYLMRNPSQANVLTSEYHSFESLSFNNRRSDSDS